MKRYLKPVVGVGTFMLSLIMLNAADQVEQKDFRLKNKLEKVDEEARSIAKRLLDVQTLICNAEKERELQLTRAQRYAQRLVTGDLAFSTELFSVIPPAQPLDEI